MTVPPEHPRSGFARWEADDALDALHRAGLDIHHVEQARWPTSAPQPRTHRQAFTFRSSDTVDPHLLLVFDSPEALEAWRLWLARYWKARPYLSIHDNVLLLVSRDLSERAAAQYHEAMAGLGKLAASVSSGSATATSAAESHDG
jgi:hypothetical protein